MIDIITNPVMISVVVMVTLCLLKCNVYFAVVISGLCCAVLGGLSIVDGIVLFYQGMDGNIKSMFTRLCLGMVAVTLTRTGVGEVLAPRITKVIGKNVWILIIGLGILGTMAETVILLASVFVTIVVPPLLPIFNKYNVDRRKAAIIVMCGLQMGYMCVPSGYGIVFQETVQTEMINNGYDIPLNFIWKANIPAAIALLVSIAVALFIFRKPRTYVPVEGVTAMSELTPQDGELPKMEWKHIGALISACVSVIVQLVTGSIQFGALCAVISIVVLRVVQWKDFDEYFTAGLLKMAYVTFIIMAGCGFANVSRNVGRIDSLVNAVASLLSNSKPVAALAMLLLGLVVTIGIGSAFGTVPIVAAVLVPLGARMGFSPAGIILLISIAAALGDAGSPASDQTLMCTAAFNMDGQHDHIWDSCVPSFLIVTASYLIVGTIAACII